METEEPPNLKSILQKSGLSFDQNDKIILSERIKHIKIDVGLSFDAPHSQNWIDHDIENNMIVFGFEANPFWIEYLLSPIKNNNFKDYHTYTKPLKFENIGNRCFIIPVALGNVETPKFMHLHVPDVSQGCGSLLVPRAETLGQIVKSYKVPVYNLSNFLDFIPFDKIQFIDYLKVDVQGYDINVLKGAGNYLSEKFVYVTAEPDTEHYYNSELNSVGYISEYMKSLNFERVAHPNTVDPTFLNAKFADKKDIYIWQKY